jgi:hypothetical protein
MFSSHFAAELAADRQRTLLVRAQSAHRIAAVPRRVTTDDARPRWMARPGLRARGGVERLRLTAEKATS